METYILIGVINWNMTGWIISLILYFFFNWFMLIKSARWRRLQVINGAEGRHSFILTKLQYGGKCVVLPPRQQVSVLPAPR